MKKLLFFSLFTFVACSEDVYQEIDQQNEILEQSSNAADDSGGVKPFTIIPGGYQSPWEFGSTVPVGYYHHTLLANDGIWVRVTPYIGLAYYDGADDGTYNTPGGGSFNLAGIVKYNNYFLD